MTSFYVYALLPSDADLPYGLRGFHDEPCIAISVGELQAVVALHGGEAPVPSPEHVQAHHDLVVRLREHAPALPVQFGTVMRDQQELFEVITERQDVLIHDMQRLAGKVEFGISVLWGSALKDVPAPETSPQPARSGADYMQRRLAEHRREEQLREIADQLESSVRDRLERIVVDADYAQLPTMKMPLRARFLVDASRADEFLSCFASLRDEFSDYRFMIVGPWPPYSFVSSGGAVSPGTFGAEGGRERSSLSET